MNRIKKCIYIYIFLHIQTFANQSNFNINTLSPAEKAAGFILLFDGKSIDPQLLVDQAGGAAQWSVDATDSALHPLDNGREICTFNKYTNFEMRIEWKAGNDQQNSGIFTRSPERGNLAWRYGAPEFAIQAGSQTGNCQSNGQAYPCFSGDNYDMQYASIHNYIDYEYNTAVLFFNGNFVEFWMNEEKVNEFEMYTQTWTDQFNNSGWPGKILAGYPYGGDPNGGYICIQDHAGGKSNALWFRNYKVREFEIDGQLPPPVILINNQLPVGTNATNFNDSIIVQLDKAVTGATIRYTLDGSEPDVNSPLYDNPLTVNTTSSLKAKLFRTRFTPSTTVNHDFIKNNVDVVSKAKVNHNIKLNRDISGELVISSTLPDPIHVEIFNTRGKMIRSIIGNSHFEINNNFAQEILFLKVNQSSIIQFHFLSFE